MKVILHFLQCIIVLIGMQIIHFKKFCLPVSTGHQRVTQAPSCYASTGAFNDCYSELTPYTVLANSSWVGDYDAYQCQGHAH